MKKNIFRTIFILAVGCLFASCYEDKGNYDYDWMPRVAIDLTNAPSAVTAGAQIYVEPVFRTVVGTGFHQTDTLATFENPERYTYSWKVYDRSRKLKADWGDSRILDTTVDLAISSSLYYVMMTVTDEDTGTQWYETFSLMVTDAFTKGLALLYADDEGKAEIDIWGTTPEKDHHFLREVLSASEYPYRGAPQFVSFDPLNTYVPYNRIWVGTDDQTGWLSLPTFEWQDNYLAAIVRNERKDDDYYYTGMTVNDFGIGFFFSADGEMAYKGYTTINQARNLLTPSISGTGGYQRVDFAQFVTGDGLSQYVWDITNKRMLELRISAVNVGGSEPFHLPSGDSQLNGYELVYMRDVATMSKFSGIFRNPAGKYCYISYEWTSAEGYPIYVVNADLTVVYPESAQSLLANAEIIEFSNGANPGVYAYSGGKLYSLNSAGATLTNVDLGAGDVITKIKVPMADGATADEEYKDKFIVAIWNETSQTGKLCVYTTNYITPAVLALEQTITDTPRVVDIVNYY